MIIDSLYARVAERGHVCIGLDTDISYLPEELQKKGADGVMDYNRAIIDSTRGLAACYKVQIAYYEALGLEGMRIYAQTLKILREAGEIVIADIKRGDIAKTAEMYAAAHFSGDFEADFITVNPYMGMDTIEPFMPWLRSGKKGLFALARTSNPGATDIEYLTTSDGTPVYRHVTSGLSKIGAEVRGKSGYSALGCVFGCTQAEEVTQIRRDFPDMFFLIPGYGAQGGKAEDVARYLHEGNGGVVNASRSILLAWKKAEGLTPAEAARNETIRMRDEILAAVQAGRP